MTMPLPYWAREEYRPKPLPFVENCTIGEEVVQDTYTFPWPVRKKLAVELLQLMPEGRWIGYLCPGCRLNKGVRHSFEYLAWKVDGSLWFVCYLCGEWWKTGLRLRREA